MGDYDIGDVAMCAKINELAQLNKFPPALIETIAAELLHLRYPSREVLGVSSIDFSLNSTPSLAKCGCEHEDNLRR
jgi:hypothetical protein